MISDGSRLDYVKHELKRSIGSLPDTFTFNMIKSNKSLNTNNTFLREIAIGLIIIAFLMFEPDGLAHRWRQIKTYWKLYPFSH